MALKKLDIEREILLLDGVLSKLKNKENIMVEVLIKMCETLKNKYNEELKCIDCAEKGFKLIERLPEPKTESFEELVDALYSTFSCINYKHIEEIIIELRERGY